jgi:hypothetical protein
VNRQGQMTPMSKRSFIFIRRASAPHGEGLRRGIDEECPDRVSAGRGPLLSLIGFIGASGIKQGSQTLDVDSTSNSPALSQPTRTESGNQTLSREFASLSQVKFQPESEDQLWRDGAQMHPASSI